VLAELAALPEVSLLDQLKEKVKKRGFGGPTEPVDMTYGVEIPPGKSTSCVIITNMYSYIHAS
jgi:hypothetical protein